MVTNTAPRECHFHYIQCSFHVEGGEPASVGAGDAYALDAILCHTAARGHAVHRK